MPKGVYIRTEEHRKKRFAGLSKKEISEIMRKMRRGEKLS